VLLTEMCTGSGHSGAALVQAACSPDTRMDTLIAMKSTAKRWAVAAENTSQKAAATLLYHLTVASALGNYGQNISSRDPNDRLLLYKELAVELADDDLAAVFEKAAARLSASPRRESDC